MPSGFQNRTLLAPHHGVCAVSIIPERLWGQAQLVTSLVLTVHPHAISMLQVCSSCMEDRIPSGQWHVMVSSGTPGDSVQLLRLPPPQSAEPSTACIPGLSVDDEVVYLDEDSDEDT